jgi:hypothetical protein
MRIKLFLSLLVTFSIPGLLNARLVQSWTYEQMLDKADLVVIATVISTKDINERYTLQDVTPPIEVVGVETEFESRIVLKGAKITKKFRLHHYRLKNDELFANGPQLVTIEPGKHRTFLLFLIKEHDGKYAPATGQTDPAIFSIYELKGGVW